uniref:CD4-1 molecule n=1 Tax=Sander lucioperca TaxID=283035 RepID=A0A8D0AK29_SANLU
SNSLFFSVTEMKNLIQSVLLLAMLMSTTGAEEFIYYAQVGEKVTLKPPGVHPQKYVYWYFNGRDLAWRNTMGKTWTKPRWKDRLSLLSDDSLIINNLEQEDFTTIFKFEVYGGPSEYTYKLLKLTGKSKNKYELTSPLLPGDSLSLSCNAVTQGPNNLKIHWLNPQGVKMRPEQLHARATSQDNGQWTCVVTNARQTHVANVFVTVIDLSPAPLSPQYTSKSRPLTVPCSLPPYISWDQIKAKGMQEVHWQFIPEPGSSPQRLFSLSLEDPLTWKPELTRGLRLVQDPTKINLSLTRDQGSEEDRGDYVCTLEFKNVALTRTVHVKVLQITSSPGTELISGQQLNLTCSLGHPLPSDLRLKWFPPKKSSLSSSSLGSGGHPTHLTIPEVGRGDGGKWRCELWQNDTRLTSAEITLKIEPKLSVWMLVVICSVTVIVILILILVFILYQHRQVQLNHSYSFLFDHTGL